MPVPLTITCFAFAILLAVMGWEIGAAIAGGLGVLNQALVAAARAATTVRAVEPVPEDYDGDE